MHRYWHGEDYIDPSQVCVCWGVLVEGARAVIMRGRAAEQRLTRLPVGVTGHFAPLTD